MDLIERDSYDEMLTVIASKAGGIQPLLDVFFSFLERKTDFYVQFNENDKQHTGGYKMGFPKGVAEKMVLHSFRKFSVKDYHEVVPPNPASHSPAVKGAGSDKAPQSPLPSAPGATTPTKPKGESSNTYNTPVKSTPAQAIPSFTPDGKQYPIGNGGVGEGYYWTQTLKDVTVYIDVEAGCKSKDVKCVIKPQSLVVEVRGQSIMNGALEDIVKTQESLWTMSTTTKDAQSQIVITLDKTKHTWWKHVIVGHSEIDTSKVPIC
jgi:hypothetical protein